MNVQFKDSFARDIRSIKDKDLLERIKELIELVEQAQSLNEISSFKKLRGGNYYRMRIGDYRVGLVVEDSLVTFVRFLHRREIYRYFP